jgi:hypothetical protein
MHDGVMWWASGLLQLVSQYHMFITGDACVQAALLLL